MERISRTAKQSRKANFLIILLLVELVLAFPAWSGRPSSTCTIDKLLPMSPAYYEKAKIALADKRDDPCFSSLLDDYIRKQTIPGCDLNPHKILQQDSCVPVSVLLTWQKESPGESFTLKESYRGALKLYRMGSSSGLVGYQLDGPAPENNPGSISLVLNNYNRSLEEIREVNMLFFSGVKRRPRQVTDSEIVLKNPETADFLAYYLPTFNKHISSYVDLQNANGSPECGLRVSSSTLSIDLARCSSPPWFCSDNNLARTADYDSPPVTRATFSIPFCAPERYVLTIEDIQHFLRKGSFEKTVEPADGYTSGTRGKLSIRLILAKQKPQFISVSVVSGATQKNVKGPKNWVTLKNPVGEVILQATTKPNTMATWKQIRWSSDSGVPVKGKPNQRRFTPSKSKIYHVKASLGEVSDFLDIWVVWASVDILTTGKVPKNSPTFNGIFDGTEKLGAVFFDGGNQAVGKIAAIGKIKPKGVHKIIKSGWALRRDIKGVRFQNMNMGPFPKGKGKNWADDTSKPKYLKLEPDSKDNIYDIDAPTIGGAHWFNTNEAYLNFRQFVEWNGKKCSDYAYWYWKARWKFDSSPDTTFKEVGLGNIPIPKKAFYSP